MEWYLAVLSKYADFSGRARRKEYWMFALINFVIALVLGVIDGVSGQKSAQTGGVGILGGLYTLAMLVPSLAVGVRRLHDTNRSAWFLLLVLIPIAGPIIYLVFLAQEGTPGENQYGSNPKMGVM